MKGIHPKLNRRALCVLAVAAFATGCRSTSSGVNNPFLAPDRVSPPSTRVLAPGQAQPYYQGDPLPTMQSAAGTNAASPLAANTAAARSSTGKTLAWNAPASGATPTVAPASVNAPWGSTPQPSAPLARANEAAVSVPTDTSDLRFALPNPTAAPAPSNVAASSAGVPQASQVSSQPDSQAVALASYNAPASNSVLPVGSTPTLGPTPQAASPWRSPQAPSVTASNPGYAQSPYGPSPSVSQPYMTPSGPVYPLAQTPQSIPANPMAVSLRAVPSPAQPGDPMPRVRVPGYDVPETAANDSFRARTSMQ
jgi:hypothetical protein